MKLLWLIARREAKALLDQKPFLLLALLVPVGYALVFGVIYWNKKVTNVPVTIVDWDNSVLSQQVTRAILSSETFRLAGYCDSVEDFRQQVWQGKSRACFVFPSHFERDVKAGRGAKVAVWVDASNILIANVVISSATTVIGTYSVGVDIRRSLLRGAAAANSPLWVVQPISDEYRLVYNPAFNYNYTNFLLLGLVTIGVQLLTLLLASQAGAREIEQGTLNELQQLTRCALPVIVGKSLVYVGIMLPVCLLALTLPPVMLDVPLLGSLGLLFGVTVWFITALVLATLGLSHLLRDSLKTTEVLAIIAMPSFLLSGYTWPTWAMPPGMQVIANLLPLSHYAMMVRKITMLGATWSDLQPQVIGLCVWSLVAIILAIVGVMRLLCTAPAPEAAS